MENDLATMTDLEIRFQEAVLAECDRLGADANNLTDEDWMLLYRQLTEENMQSLAIFAARASLNFSIK